MVPKVILFRLEHTRRTLVEKVDFISAPGASADNVYRPGGPIALITNRCLFAFDRRRRRFALASVHPGHTVAEVIENTGFDFDRPRTCRRRPPPPARSAHPADGGGAAARRGLSAVRGQGVRGATNRLTASVGYILGVTVRARDDPVANNEEAG